MALADKIIEQNAWAIFKSAVGLADSTDEVLIAGQRVERPEDWRRAEIAAREAFEKAIQPPMKAKLRDTRFMSESSLTFNATNGHKS